jgi:hypothetical protein
MGLTNPRRRLKVRSVIDRSHPNESVCLVDVGFSSAPLQYIGVETAETLVSYGTRAGVDNYAHIAIFGSIWAPVTRQQSNVSRFADGALKCSAKEMAGQYEARHGFDVVCAFTGVS